MSYDRVENHWYCPTPPQITSYVPSIVLSATVVEWLGVMCWQWVIEATSFNIDYCNRAVMCLVVGDKCEMLLE
jgi:hypothetical protein